MQKKSNKQNISGWLILNKPYDLASTKALNHCRYLLNAKKAGHAGTLDPLATGVLPIAFGEATKTIPFIQDAKKTYIFSLIWGEQTLTDDKEGEIIAKSDIRPTKEEVRKTIKKFIGEIEQIPPKFSAIKIDGERAYNLARKGEEIEMKPRKIFIEEIELLEHGKKQSLFKIICAKGTYIRSLARDLALELNTRGHVGSLHRANVGHFSDSEAVSLSDFKKASLKERKAMLLPISKGLENIVKINLNESQVQKIKLGNPALLTGADAPINLELAWASFKGEALAIGYVEKGHFKPKRLILMG